MSHLVSTLATVAGFLGIWTAASLVATPVLVLCLRGQARSNARFTREATRRAWRDAAVDA